VGGMTGDHPGIDISIVVTAHREGRLAHHTMNSLLRACKYANQHTISTEIVAILDRPDLATENYFNRYTDSEIVMLSVDFGDPGLSRNHGAALSSGKYVTFLDADDLFGKHWLKAAYFTAKEYNIHCVLHPEYTVCFEREDLIARHLGICDEGFHYENLLEHSYWSSFCFLERSLFMERPFTKTSANEGFGYEDWHWYCEVLADDIPILIVPGTCVFVRRKYQGSRLVGHNQGNTMIPPTRLFDPARFFSLMDKERKIQRNQKESVENEST
jgi:glycosyltransferase involved in cell wall biosynthesis